ncbi:MAG: nucleoside kinase [Oscillospiraceae bacterium]|nr:nucleoside kinase [Oscillospiraceae bacterium]
MKIIIENKNSRIQMSEINELAKEPEKFVLACEETYNSQLRALVDKLMADKKRCVVLLAGPSSSGKTTTAHKITELLKERGRPAHVISLDDFFLGMEYYPKLPDGTPDTECVEALDLPLINETFSTLVSTGKAVFPTFDFTTSSRGKDTYTVELGEDGVVVVEGLHALNPRLVEALPPDTLFRAYVSTRTVYLDGEREVLTPKDARFVRRMVRDHYFRGRAPIDTLLGWKDVLGGEEKYIYPFRDTVDHKIDSSFDYEACVFHHYVLPILEDLKKNTVSHAKAYQLVNMLEEFDDIDYKYIPENSLLREFIGNGPVE